MVRAATTIPGAPGEQDAGTGPLSDHRNTPDERELPMPTPDPLVVEELLALEAQRCRAISAGDLAALGGLLHDDLVHVHATGRAQDKQEYLSSLGGKPRTTTRRDLAVRVYGGTAVMTGVLLNAFGQGADRQVSEAYATQVWVASNGGWRLASFAASGPVPTAAAGAE
jgi:ketosteroid isomerase-like protein